MRVVCACMRIFTSDYIKAPAPESVHVASQQAQHSSRDALHVSACVTNLLWGFRVMVRVCSRCSICCRIRCRFAGCRRTKREKHGFQHFRVVNSQSHPSNFRDGQMGINWIDFWRTWWRRGAMRRRGFLSSFVKYALTVNRRRCCANRVFYIVCTKPS